MSTVNEKIVNTLKKGNDVVKASPVPPTMLGLKSVQVKDIFEKFRLQIAQALPKHLTADRVIQLATTLITRSPELSQCSTESLIGAVMQASILGFEPVHALGQCYLVPFNNTKSGKKEIQFIIGYKGMLELARRSNEITTIYAQCVYDHDQFEYEYGLDPKIVHKPALENRGDFKFAYAVAKFVNGGFAFEVMSKFDIEKVRKRSAASSSKFSPWSNADDYTEMAKKTVIRRLFKYLPISIEKQTVTDGAVIESQAFTQNGEVDTNQIKTEYEIVDTSTGEVTTVNEDFFKEESTSKEE